MVDLPLDVLHLITEVVGEPPHPLSYTIDTASLHALCLVSRFFNAVTTPMLYSSIILPDQRSVGCLLSTAKSNPRLLQLCHSIYWPGWRLSFVEQKILSAMTGLHRFFTSQSSGRPLGFLTNSTIRELIFTRLTFEEFCRQCYQHTFPNLERLVIETITYSGDVLAVEAFVRMPRLTHVAIASVDQVYLDQAMTGYFDDMVAIIDNTPPSCRIIFGLTANSSFDYDRFRSRITERFPERGDSHVVFLTYTAHRSGGTWFSDRIIDGTLWDMESVVDC